jgi:hypothetical protein
LKPGKASQLQLPELWDCGRSHHEPLIDSKVRPMLHDIPHGQLSISRVDLSRRPVVFDSQDPKATHISWWTIALSPFACQHSHGYRSRRKTEADSRRLPWALRYWRIQNTKTIVPELHEMPRAVGGHLAIGSSRRIPIAPCRRIVPRWLQPIRLADLNCHAAISQPIFGSSRAKTHQK